MAQHQERPPCPRPACRTDGFTLVELLVVIAVIAILASLLMPAILGGMRASRQAKCASNLLQVFAGLKLYAARHYGHLPPAGAPPEAPAWWETAGPMLGDRGILDCAAVPEPSPAYGLSHHWAAGPDLTEAPDALLTWLAPHLDDARIPSRTVFVCGAGLITNPSAPPEDWREGPDPTVTVRFPHDNHLGQADGAYTYWRSSPWRPVPRHPPYDTNCLFLDAHVESIPTRDLVDDLWGEPDCLYDNQ